MLEFPPRRAWPVREALQAGALDGAPTALPAPGDVVSRDPPLRWHAVDTDRYNVNQYHWGFEAPDLAGLAVTLQAR